MGQALPQRTEKELAVLRLMHGLSLRLAEEMLKVTGGDITHAQLTALSNIARTPGLSQSDLAARLHRSSVHVSRLIDEVELLGLVERRTHRFDRRSKVLYASDDGLVVYDRMRDRAIELAAEIFRDTPDERLTILSEQAARISQRLHLAIEDEAPGF